MQSLAGSASRVWSARAASVDATETGQYPSRYGAHQSPMAARRRAAIRFALAPLMLALLAAGSLRAATIPVLTIDGPIGPATAQYVGKGLEEAKAEDAPAVVLKMNTPGGLSTAMRDIIGDILASPIPVITWVAPSGARAASAGTYILYASHVAAMAPGTNLGAATPVQVGGMPGSPSPGSKDGGSDEGGSTMEHKMVNDAVAYIRSLADLRGRNAEWAERAVRESASMPANKAAEENVVDFIAGNMAALLQAADGRNVKIGDSQVQISVANADTRELAPGWRNELLAVITNPNVAYILMLLGVYGLIFELANPGSIVPGVVGGIALLLALLAFQALPINYAGLALLAMGVAFMIGEALVASFGALGIGGVIAFVIGSLLLFDTDAAGFRLSLGLVGGVAVASLLVSVGIATLAVRAYRRPHVTGRQGLRGMRATVVEAVDGNGGRVRVHGELWRAVSDRPLAVGTRVRVTSSDGLTVTVAPGGNHSPRTDRHTR